MSRKLTSKQETENQLKDAKALASAPGGIRLPITRIKGKPKFKVIGEWHAK